MTKEKVRNNEIDSVLQEQCRRLLNRADKVKMAKQLNCSINLVTTTISGDRYNSTVIAALEKFVVKKVDEIQKQLAVYNEQSK